MKKVKTLVNILIVSTLLSSCMGTRHLTSEEKERRAKIENQLDWLHWNYSNTKDSLLIEYYKK